MFFGIDLPTWLQVIVNPEVILVLFGIVSLVITRYFPKYLRIIKYLNNIVSVIEVVHNKEIKERVKEIMETDTNVREADFNKFVDKATNQLKENGVDRMSKLIEVVKNRY